MKSNAKVINGLLNRSLLAKVPSAWAKGTDALGDLKKNKSSAFYRQYAGQ